MEVYEHVRHLLNESSRFTLTHWHSWGRLYERILKNGDPDRFEPREFIATEGVLQIHTLATLNGQIAGIDFSDPALETTCGWAAPEIIRRHAVELLKTDLRQGEAWLSHSIALARQQEALAWELRTMTSLARHWHGKGDSRRAADELSAVYAKFSEGFETKDLKTAKHLLSIVQAP